MAPATERRRRRGRLAWAAVGLGGVVFLVVVVLLRLTVVTDYLYHSTVKDPERTPPATDSIVAPADGTVLYVRRVEGGVVPEVVKRGVPIPLVDHLKTEPDAPIRDGWLIGIYMNTFGVHINRVPNHGFVRERIVFNGPHMDMSEAERRLILREMIPGLVTLRKLLGQTAHGTENDADFVLQSARETLVLEDERGVRLFVVRIADYYVGKILTWVGEEQAVRRGDRLGMITWGSQTDLYIEETPGIRIRARVGDYVYGGESVLATY